MMRRLPVSDDRWGVLLRDDGTVYMSELAARGWTATMVSRLLGDADHPTVRGRRNKIKTAARWDLGRVRRAEAGPEFGVLAGKAAVRSAAAKASAATRSVPVLEWARSVEIVPPVRRPIDEIRAAGVRHWEVREARRGRERDRPGLDRLACNLLRHEMTDYDALLDAKFGSLGVTEGRWIVRRRVYQAIASVYPELAAECVKQIARRERKAGIDADYGI